MASSNGISSSEILEWKLGLINDKSCYLTAETFGFKINASGNTLRKKQTWTLVHDNKEEDTIYIRSHLNRFMRGDSKGNVFCDSEEKSEDTQFRIIYKSDGSGKCAFQNKKSTYYFGGIEDNLRCYEKEPTDSEWWIANLALHPQVNVQSVHRKKYAHLSEAGDEIHVDELIPWGKDALITLEYNEGKYAIKTCSDLYLESSGSLVSQTDQTTLFTIEFISGHYSGLALKDHKGHYLTAVGANGLMKSRDKSAKQDRIFAFQDSHPQVFITAHNSKKCSIKQGVDVTANQEEVTDLEVFQVEFDKKDEKWRLRTSENKHWKMIPGQGSGIQANGNNSDPNGLFMLEYLEDGQVAVKAANDKYITAKMNGALTATSDNVDKCERYMFTIMNRPILVLRCEWGFIGFKTPANPQLQCNKSIHDELHLEHTSGLSPHYYIKGCSGKYLSLDSCGNISADSSEPHPFILELVELSKFLIKAPNGSYLKGEQNGIVQATADRSNATKWEF